MRLYLVLVDPFPDEKRKAQSLVDVVYYSCGSAMVPNGEQQSSDDIRHVVNSSDQQHVHHEQHGEEGESGGKLQVQNEHFQENSGQSASVA